MCFGKFVGKNLRFYVFVERKSYRYSLVIGVIRVELGGKD